MRSLEVVYALPSLWIPIDPTAGVAPRQTTFPPSARPLLIKPRALLRGAACPLLGPIQHQSRRLSHDESKSSLRQPLRSQT
jgi:hypothetical protein